MTLRAFGRSLLLLAACGLAAGCGTPTASNEPTSSGPPVAQKADVAAVPPSPVAQKAGVAAANEPTNSGFDAQKAALDAVIIQQQTSGNQPSMFPPSVGAR